METEQKGTVQQYHTYDKRFYRVMVYGEEEPKWYLSVNTIIGGTGVDPFLAQWQQEQVAERGVQGARFDLFMRAEMGTTVHNAIDRYNRGEELCWDDFDDFEWACINRFIEWLTSSGAKVVASEHTIVSHTHRYAGTLDMIVEIEGKLYVIDVKSGSYTYDRHKMQLAAYVMAAREMYPTMDIVGAGVLPLNVRTKKGWRFDVLEESDIQRYFARFLNRYAVFMDENEGIVPKHVVYPRTITPTHNFDILEDSYGKVEE